MFEQDSKTVYDHPVHKLTRKRFTCDVCKEKAYIFNNGETFTYYNVNTTFNNGTEWSRNIECCDLDCVSAYIKRFDGDPDFNRCQITKQVVTREYYSL